MILDDDNEYIPWPSKSFDRFNWTPERIEELKILWADPASTPLSIAQHFGIANRRSVDGKARKLGLPSKKYKWSTQPDRDDMLKRMWSAGASRGEIANVLGITPNAVGGRVHRLGLPPRPEWPVGRRRNSVCAPGARRRGAERPKSLKPQMPREEAAGIAGNLKRIRIGSGHVQPAAPIAAEPLSPEINETPTAHNCTFLELTNTTCRWPIGDPGTPVFRFCGHPSADLDKGRPYCARHAGVAFCPQPRFSARQNFLSARMTAGVSQ